MATKPKKSSGSATTKAGGSQSAKVTRTSQTKSTSSTKKPAPPATPKKSVTLGFGSLSKSEFVGTLDKLRSAKSLSEVASSKKKLIEMIKKVKPVK